MKTSQDEEHLRLLSIFHYVLGGITAFFSLIPLIHVAIGILVLYAPEEWSQGGPPPPPWFGWMFIGIGASIIVLGETMAILQLLAGRFLGRRTHPRFCFVVACIECLSVPLGTTLGVFTILKLVKPEVRAMFDTY